jgi:hypothetical protein
MWSSSSLPLYILIQGLPCDKQGSVVCGMGGFGGEDGLVDCEGVTLRGNGSGSLRLFLTQGSASSSGLDKLKVLAGHRKFYLTVPLLAA